MPDNYMNLDIADQQDILQAAAAQLGRQPAVLEKDIWVNQDRKEFSQLDLVAAGCQQGHR